MILVNVCADVRSYEAGQDQKIERIRGTKKGGNHKKVQERRLKWFAIQKRGTLRRKDRGRC